MRKLALLFAVICATATLFAQETKHTIATQKWNTDSLGNHRAVVMVNSNTPIAKATILWRRRDDHPENKRIIVEDAQTHQKVTNVKGENITNFSGNVYFQPVSGKGIYYVYYMPYKNEGRSNYPKGVYLKPETTTDNNWLQQIRGKTKPTAVVQEIESIDSLNSFYPMEIIATKNETDAVIKKGKNKDYIVFPEDRIYPIKMQDYLPYRWIQRGSSNTFKGEADRGENYSFQIGIYTLQNIQNVSISFNALTSTNGKLIPASAISCLNNTGIKYDGSPFTSKVNIGADSVQAMWCLVDVPKDIPAGVYKGKATINSNVAPQTVNSTLR